VIARHGTRLVASVKGVAVQKGWAPLRGKEKNTKALERVGSAPDSFQRKTLVAWRT